MIQNKQPKLASRPLAASRLLLAIIVLICIACTARTEALGKASSRLIGCEPRGDASLLTPKLVCTAASKGETFALWRYSLAGSGSVTVPIGPQNAFVPAPAPRGQPTRFRPASDAPFAVPFAGASTLTWNLGLKSETATPASGPTCITTTDPKLGDVAVVAATGERVALRTYDVGHTMGSIVPTEAFDPSQGQTVGELEGNFAASADGAATYSIAIRVAPGRLGIEPRVALTYSSGATNGIAGVGWGLSGVSRIARCKKTIASDGINAAVAFTATDRYCLDGDYLVEVARPDGQTIEYRPEHQPQTKVVANIGDSTGPSSFTVWDRDGLIHRFGTGSSKFRGQVVGWTGDPKTSTAPTKTTTEATYAWYVSETEDRFGNGMYYVYRDPDASCASSYPACGTFELVLDSIHYTTSTKDAPATPGGIDRPSQRELRFVYEPRTDEDLQYVGGFPIRTTVRLKQLEIYAPDGNGTKNRAWFYSLSYAYSGMTARSILQSARQCDNGGVCSQPTTFGYEAGSTTFLDRDLGPDEAAGVYVPNYTRIVADLNGDGKDDLLYGVRDSVGEWDGAYGYEENIRWRFRLSNGVGFEPAQDAKVPNARGYSLLGLITSPMPLDINGDGKMEVAFPTSMWPHGGEELGHWTYWSLAAGATGFERIDDPVNEKAGCGLNDCVLIGLNRVFYVADMDGDGRNEVLRPRAPFPGGTLSWDIRPSATGSLLPYRPLLNAVSGASFQADQGGYVGDLTGGGQSGLIFLQRSAPTVTGHVRYSYATTNPDGSAKVDVTSLVAPSPGTAYQFVDLNGDGIADAINLPDGGDFPSVSINTGRGLPSFADLGPSAPFRTPGWSFGRLARNKGLRWMDLDEDGRLDLVSFGNNLAARSVEGVSPGATTILTRASRNGPRFADPRLVWTSTNPDDPYASLTPIPVYDVENNELALTNVLDVNGDGLQDVVAMRRQSDGPHLHLYTRHGKRADMLVSVEKGFGSKVSVAYDPHVDSFGTNCEYPLFCRQRGLWLVSHFGFDPGVTFEVTYSGGRVDLQGRGHLGFEERRVSEGVYGSTTVTRFENSERFGTDYPKAHKPYLETYEVALGPGIVHRRVHWRTYEMHGGLPPTAPYSTLVQFAEDTEEEPPATLQRIETTYGYDPFDNVNFVERRYGSGGRSRTTYEYDQNPAAWLMSLPRRVEVFEEAAPVPGMPPPPPPTSNETVFDTDPFTGVTHVATTEPSSADPADVLSTEFVRDSYGRVIAKRVYPRFAPDLARETAVEYDSLDGVFPAKIINPAGHATRIAYHPTYGVPVWVRQADGVELSYQYDGLGRLRRSSLFDATGTLVRTETARYTRSGTDSQVLRDSPLDGLTIVTLDRLGREKSREKNGFAPGSRVRSDTAYDYFFLSKPRTVTDWYEVGASPSRKTDFVYDALGRTAYETFGPGEDRVYTYDGLRRRIDWLYDYGSAKKSEIVETDDRGRVIRSGQILVDATGTREIANSFAYGPFDRLFVARDPMGNESRFEYDRRGRRKFVHDVNTGATEFQYNAFGEVERAKTDRFDVEYGYDALGRPIGHADEEGLSCLFYDGETQATGKLSQTVAADGTTNTLSYDALGLVREDAWLISGSAYSASYAYTLGRLSSVRYPDGRTVRQTYAPSGALQEYTEDGFGSLWRADEADASGRLLHETFGDGSSTSYSYHSLVGRPVDIHTQRAGISVFHETYGYHGDGKLSFRKDELKPPANPDGNREFFDYDTLDRLVGWRSDGSSPWAVGYLLLPTI